MFKKLHRYAAHCPIVSDKAPYTSVSHLFRSDSECRCVVLADKDGAPVGVYLSGAPKTLRREFIAVERSAPTKTQVDYISSFHPDVLAYGAVLTVAGRVTGWVTPEALIAWLSRMAQATLKEVEAQKAAMEDVQQQSLVFLANMSHELRTPLNAVLGYADLMREETFGPVQPTQYGKYIDSIHLSGQHLLNTINAVLNLARVDAGVISLDEENVKVDNLIDQVIEMMAMQSAQLDVQIVKIVPKATPDIYGDPQLLRQALLNLLSNAVKFAPAGSKVRLSVARTVKGGLRFTVSDNGPGIPASELNEILEPFKQASHGPGRTGVGTGLGLSLVKGFIELHEGRVNILSEEGRGTRVVLTIPSGRVIDHKVGFQTGFAFVRPDSMLQKQPA